MAASRGRKFVKITVCLISISFSLSGCPKTSASATPLAIAVCGQLDRDTLIHLREITRRGATWLTLQSSNVEWSRQVPVGQIKQAGTPTKSGKRLSILEQRQFVVLYRHLESEGKIILPCFLYFTSIDGVGTLSTFREPFVGHPVETVSISPFGKVKEWKAP